MLKESSQCLRQLCLSASQAQVSPAELDAVLLVLLEEGDAVAVGGGADAD
jgi:hypothetical protein